MEVDIMNLITIFILAVFVGNEIINKVVQLVEDKVKEKNN